MTTSEDIARFVDVCNFGELPNDMVEFVKMRVLDVTGLIVAARAGGHAAPIRAAARVAEMRGPSTVVGEPDGTSAMLAGLVNGTLAHALDFDDTHIAGQSHPSSVIIPVALAVAEEVGASGKEMIAAAAAGYEVMVRMGLLVPGGFVRHGFHTTSVVGTFAAGLVAAKLYGLSEAGIADALGIAGSQAAGMVQCVREGSTIKRTHSGWAAMAGVMAASCAAAGMTGPRLVLEGEDGLYRTHLPSETIDVSLLAEGLGQTWRGTEVAVKPYPCCQLLHAYIDCALDLRAGVGSLDSVVGIRCLVPEGEVGIICEPWRDKVDPATDYAARFSLPVTVAAAFLDGEVGLGTFDPSMTRRPQLQELIQKVDYTVDEDTVYPSSQPGKVVVRLKDGTEHQRVVLHSVGSPSRPLTKEQITAKFQVNLEFAAAGANAEDLIDLTDSFDALDDLGEFSTALRNL